MYNPSRGGVRGGADQFTWESVKSDKHRENYLGHSLKAPVGRWQKGKDLSWYAKERKDSEAQDALQKTDIAAIKKAEEEAMLIALGHNVVKRESQPLTKEEMREALKRNVGSRDDNDVDRVDGIGSGRKALLAGESSKRSNEGVSFETSRKRFESSEKKEEASDFSKTEKEKKSKKHKRNKHNDSEEYDSHRKSSKVKKKRKHQQERKSSISDSDSDNHKSSKKKKKRKYEQERKSIPSNSDSDNQKQKKHKKRKRHDSSSDS